ncbi:L-histidine N(alpha)-methyltransferase [Marinibactrum halimedae]|uniref:Dimethylhistidine N-methyltransferase n=1 Tax=Marinibactrum halimedae TaxID=1444977 RepID=A0AA37T5Q8_9GAMM|nr:L-histidine N(alpha)-methyltransferase [Marinibactrum halimedae]MCD9460602.1 L-histidine N(alpha)-methyltransferase [Marinibactrum halimedae]GLS27818.1 dimethylhistidine N-methyltransferase [Marinibactrum halimedae]
MITQSNAVPRQDLATSDDEFLEDVLDGLSQRQKTLPCKYFYDERGSQLFDDICQTEDYYVTRTERAIMERYIPEMAALVGPGASILEFGSGVGEKIRRLLTSLEAPHSYTPMDISYEPLMASAEQLRQEFPSLTVDPVCGDYLQPWPSMPVFLRSSQRLVYFPGSTLSNFTPEQASDFLSRIAKLLGSGGGLLIGVDLIKPIEVLHDAYNDREGVTAEFNKNVLSRINQALDGNFNLESFEHNAFFNEQHNRIEMHLCSQVDQRVEIAGQEFRFSQGESIHTENSYKYSTQHLHQLFSRTGYRVVDFWTDPNQYFSVHYCTVQ